ncbi:DUF4136 domain-containing protein [Ramlibacter sp.]|uniref:DUF4136 domain-containing protein n=1 Tax=Ramlibacter sp. TaxID=1917967 RepID=UPI003D149EE5
MRSVLRRAGAAVLAGFALALTGCATGYLLDNNVQSFSHLTAVPSPATYRFERLPSQSADPVQSQLEALADPALHKAGFRRDDSQPRYSVQVTARVERVPSPYSDPWDRFGFGWGFSGRRWGIGGGLGRLESPWYRREVGLVVRELAGNKVVYETRAANDGPWLDNASVLPAMFDAALQGFPNAPQGLRRVDIHVGAPAAAPR